MAGDSHAPHTERGAIPTNVITYKGRKIPARIDPDARLAHVVEIMANSFSAKEHHITLCLRDEADGLVTQTNLPSKVINHDALKLVASPTTEALAVIHSLKNTSSRRSLERRSLEQSTASLNTSINDGLPLKLALFNFQKYVKEEDFSVEFMLKGGMRMLLKMLDVRDGGLSGNSLAYALQGLRGILEYESAWSDLSDEFIDRIIDLVLTATQPNILRPATAVLRKLVISSPGVSTSGDRRVKHRKGKSKVPVGHPAAGTPTSKEAARPAEEYGFDRIFKRMEAVTPGPDDHSDGIERVVGTIVKRLEGAGDLELVSQSLGFINAALRAGYQSNAELYPFLITVLEHVHVRKYISRLIPTSANNIVEPQILNFQARYAAILSARRLQPVKPAPGSEDEKMLADIWHAGNMGRRDSAKDAVRDSVAGKRSMEGWTRLGMTWEEDGDRIGMENEGEMFRDTGELGLECMHWFSVHDESFYTIVIEQQAKQPDRQCPIGRASAECVKILCEHYKISQAGHHAPPRFQLFLLNFPRLHHLVLRFFLRMWQESESRQSDFPRVAFLVRSHVRSSLEHEGSKNWLALESDLLESDYRSIRDRQMEALEQEDGMLNRPAVLDLREKLYGDAYEVMAEQRIGCMLAGGWFNSANLITPGITPSVKPNGAKPLRFLRLSPNRKTIGWADFASRSGENPSYESLRERIDISNITDIRLQTSCAIGSRSPNLTSKLSFSLMSGGELSLMDVDAIHAAQLAEWTDGIRVLRGEVGMRSTESANYVHILTELALKVRLLDITGDGVDIPDKVAYGQAPQSADFWFAK